MATDLKPAHEVIVSELEYLSGALIGIDKAISAGGVESFGRWVPAAEIELGRLQEVGGFCKLLKILERMLIPEDKLGGVIEALRNFKYRHGAIRTTIENLTQRKAPATKKVGG